MSGIVIIDALILVVLLVIGVPVPFCFSAAVIFLVIAGDYPSATFLIPAGFGKISSIVILAIPLYILAGGLMSQGGIAGRLVDLADSIFGRLRGGMGVVVVVATAIFGAISGMASSLCLCCPATTTDWPGSNRSCPPDHLGYHRQDSIRQVALSATTSSSILSFTRASDSVKVCIGVLP